MRLAPDMPELLHDPAAAGMHRIGDRAPSRDLAVVVDARRAGIAVALARDRRRLRDEEAARGRALRVVFTHQRVGQVTETGPHPGQRRHDDAMAELDRAHAPRCEQLRHDRFLVWRYQDCGIRALTRAMARSTAGRRDTMSNQRATCGASSKLTHANSRRHSQPKWAMSGDCEFAACDEGSLRQHPVQHGERPRGLRREAFDRERLWLRRLALEEARLPEGWPETGRVEEQLLKYKCAARAGLRQQLAGALGKMHEDGGRFRQHQTAAERVLVDQHGHLAVRAQRTERRRLLLAAAHIDGVERVVEPQLLERDRHLDAVGGRERIDVEHDQCPSTARATPLRRIEAASTIKAADGLPEICKARRVSQTIGPA